MSNTFINTFLDILKDKSSKADSIPALIKPDSAIISDLRLGIGTQIVQLSIIKNETGNSEFNINIGEESNYINAINITEESIKFNIPFETSKLIISDNVENTDINVNNIANINILHISKEAIFTGPVSLLSTLTIDGVAEFGNIKGKNISSINNDSLLLENQTLNINAKYINIGNGDSLIKIQGTTTYVETTELFIKDKIISLNLNERNTGAFDIGGDSGITISGINGDGYIKTNNLATRFLIKTPLETVANYINTVDLNNNLTISGMTYLSKDVNIYSSIYVSGQSRFN